jgi:hypothetical protein
MKIYRSDYDLLFSAKLAGFKYARVDRDYFEQGKMICIIGIPRNDDFIQGRLYKPIKELFRLVTYIIEPGDDT